ncbi:unnamed protein product [Rhizoctonia solani]|uniref:Uncharacterized protein n=1 Tax=Rhizoctonia solani TaxID=456999 RepID=A0A8H3HA46_9AGAM|nr:unnamed protein product [Rhizoctonia solani]
MLRSPLTRHFTIALFVLSLSMIIWCGPAEANNNLIARAGECTVDCTTGIDIFNRMMKLQDDLQPKYQVLDGHYTAGTDPTPVAAEIAGLFDAASTDIEAHPKDTTGVYNGKASAIANLADGIAADVAAHYPGPSDEVSDSAFQSIFTAALQLAGALSGKDDSFGLPIKNIIADLAR